MNHALVGLEKNTKIVALIRKKMTKRKIKWFEPPVTVSMKTDELVRVLRDQSNHFDIFPSAWLTEWESPYVKDAEIHDDEGTTFLLAKKVSKNTWRVRTNFN
jgi:hypothetical protein